MDEWWNGCVSRCRLSSRGVRNPSFHSKSESSEWSGMDDSNHPWRGKFKRLERMKCEPRTGWNLRTGWHPVQDESIPSFPWFSITITVNRLRTMRKSQTNRKWFGKWNQKLMGRMERYDRTRFGCIRSTFQLEIIHFQIHFPKIGMQMKVGTKSQIQKIQRCETRNGNLRSSCGGAADEWNG